MALEINLLFSIDDTFVEQFQTTLYSIYENSPENDYQVFVLQKGLLEKNSEIQSFCEKIGVKYNPVVIEGEHLFKDAPVSKRYPETIYYRLLSHLYLPKTLNKILYLDADILCINDITSIYKTDLREGILYAAASHSQLTNVTSVINKVRLGNYEAEGYFNSGVLLMNLAAIRKTVRAEDIFAFIDENKLNLFLPDQDILNALYGKNILRIPDQIYNYDVRKNAVYEAISSGAWDMDYIIENTVFLHFCGKDKPWYGNYRGRFSSLYKHYAHKTERKETGPS